MADVKEDAPPAAAADEVMDAAEEEVAAQEEEEEAGDAPAAGEEAAGKEELPHGIKLGFKTFKSVGTAREYFKALLATWPVKVDMNEYEHRAVLDLLKQHPDHERKLGVGAKAFQVCVACGPQQRGDLLPHVTSATHPTTQRRTRVRAALSAHRAQVRTWVPPDAKDADVDSKTRAFHVVRKDGSVEDFSYVKCLAALFPGLITPAGERDAKRARRDDGGKHGGGGRHGKGGGGGGRGGGGRRGGRGRGGRGRH